MGAPITRVETLLMPALGTVDEDSIPEWALPAVHTPRAQDWPDNRTRMAVRITTEDEAGCFAPVSAAVATLVTDQLGPSVVGQDSLTWRWLDELRLAGRHQRGPHARMALSSVELALWDLRSRLFQRPVTDLLGGARREYVPAYATALGINIDHPLAGDIARWIADQGFWAQKWCLPGCMRDEPAQADIARLGLVRDAIGEQTRLCIDVAGAWDHGYARRMVPALAEHRVEWVEEPTPVPARWFAEAGIAVAGGEHDVDLDDQLRAVSTEEVQVWQPDPAWNGGLVPSLRSVDLTAAAGLLTCPHGTALPVSSVLAGLHTARQVPAIEYHLTLEPLRQGGMHSPITPVAGLVPVRNAPGIADFLTEPMPPVGRSVP